MTAGVASLSKALETTFNTGWSSVTHNGDPVPVLWPNVGFVGDPRTRPDAPFVEFGLLPDEELPAALGDTKWRAYGTVYVSVFTDLRTDGGSRTALTLSDQAAAIFRGNNSVVTDDGDTIHFEQVDFNIVGPTDDSLWQVMVSVVFRVDQTY